MPGVGVIAQQSASLGSRKNRPPHAYLHSLNGISVRHQDRTLPLLKEAGYPSLPAWCWPPGGIHTTSGPLPGVGMETSLTISPMLLQDMDKAVAPDQKALANDETIAPFR